MHWRLAWVGRRLPAAGHGSSGGRCRTARLTQHLVLLHCSADEAAGQAVCWEQAGR
jgi:hypothetical protein